MNDTISQASLIEAIKTLLIEGYLAPPDPRSTWFADNEANAGFVGLLDRVNAAQASKVQGYPEGGSLAAHAYHIHFALDLVARELRGESAFATAQWSTSWAKTSVTEAEWATLRAEIRELVALLHDSLAPGPQWNDGPMLIGMLSVVAHGAWHLGAIRQLLVGL